MQHALVQRANPQVHFIPGEHLDVEIVQGWMQLANLFPVVEKYAVLLCADQKMSCSNRQDSGNRSHFGIGRIDLTEAFSVEEQDSLARCSHHELRLGRIS